MIALEFEMGRWFINRSVEAGWPLRTQIGLFAPLCVISIGSAKAPACRFPG